MCFLCVGLVGAALDYHHHHHSAHTITSQLVTDGDSLNDSFMAWDHKYALFVKSWAKILAPLPPSWWDQSPHVWLEHSHLLQKQKPVPDKTPLGSDGSGSPFPPDVVSSREGNQKAQIVWKHFWDAVTLVLLCAICASVYMHFKRPNYDLDVERQESFDSWRDEWYSLPESNADWQICVCACFCPCIRWAETHSRVKPHHNFWLLFLAYSGCWVSSRLGWFAIFGFLMLVSLSVYFRDELRSQYNMKQGPKFVCFDCLLFVFCGCCAIAQEARHVERSMRAQHCSVCPPPI